MLLFILRRILLMIPTLLAITVVSFVIIEAPPGDFIDVYVERITAQQQAIDPSEVDALRARYGLGQPAYVRYFRWLGAIVPIGGVLFLVGWLLFALAQWGGEASRE